MSKKKRKPDLSEYENRGPLCPHFDVCGGCTHQKISYEKQLEMKLAEVKDLLSDAGEFVFEGILPSPLEERYRNKMEFTFGDEYKDGPFALGLHMRGSFMNIVNITDCHLIHNDLNVIRNASRDFFNEFYEKKQITFRNNKTHRGYLRHLLLRRGEKTGELLAALVTSTDYPADAVVSEEELLKDFSEMLLGLSVEGQITGILHILNDSMSDVVKSDRTDILYGRDHIYDEVLGLRFKISVFSFFQTNTLGAEVLYSKTREYASDAHGMLFDLYCGTGTISQLMSAAVDEVTGVEIVPEAVEAAKENAELNGISNVKFIAGDVLKVLDSLPVPDSLILDPPREGINPKALGKLLRYNVEYIVYVSCKPTSLARDLKSLRLAGYEVKKACCVDMFPQTGHVETVVLMSKNEGLID